MALPIPREEPVTMATLPVRSNGSLMVVSPICLGDTMISKRLGGKPLRGDDLLLDLAEDRVPLRIPHLDRDPVARLHERRRRLAAGDRLDHADFRDAGIAGAAFADRRAGTAVCALVAHRARA